jgi:hypothetical protein
VTDQARRPWDRLEHETPKAFQAFLTYRDLGPGRSVRAAYEHRTGKTLKGNPPAHYGRWSADFGWYRRAAAYDDETARLNEQAQREADASAIADMRKRHITAAMAAQQKALQALQKVDPTALTPNAIIRFLVQATKLERVARGEPATITEDRSTPAPGAAGHADPDGVLARILSSPDAIRAARDLSLALEADSRPLEGEPGIVGEPPQ